MYVYKRNGAKEIIEFSKIKSKIDYFKNYIYNLDKIDVDLLVEQVKLGLHNEINTCDIDVFTARKCLELTSLEPSYEILATRILVNNHHKNTLTSFKDKMDKMYRRVDSKGERYSMINKTFFKFICTNQRRIENMIDYQRDYLLDAFGFLTLQGQYLTKIDDKVIERPQDIFMREAITLCFNPLDFNDEKALEEINYVYDLLSTKKYTYATPTLNNSGMTNQQLSSCYLLGSGDSLEAINKTACDAAAISKEGGGIGLPATVWRSAGELIRSTNGKSSGIKNFLKIYDSVANAYNQGGKRKGSFAIYLRDFHPDLMEFIYMKNPIGDENSRAKNLFYAVALSDKFWKCVENDETWYFIDPMTYPHLDTLYGEEFEKVYDDLVKDKKWKKSLPAREILKEIMKNLFESGVPYILNFDHVNRKNNLKHYSSITTSNLCIEITLPSNEHEYGVCNLASVVLPSFVIEKSDKETFRHSESYLRFASYKPKTFNQPVFDYHGLAKTVQIITRTMDRVIDRNTYPVKEAMISNLIHRPIGIGTSGFADVCCLMRIPYDSEEGVELCKRISETIAYASISESSRLAKTLTCKGIDQKEASKEIFSLFENSKKYNNLRFELNKLYKRSDYNHKKAKELEKELDGIIENPIPKILELVGKMGVYPSYYYGEGAPISKGEFQWKMWGLEKKDLSGMWDWDTLEEHVKKFGIRNSLLTCQMPTASTSQIMGVAESCEAFTTNMYRRSILSGEYIVFNKYLIRELINLGIWTEDVRNMFIANNGSVSNISGIPDYIKEQYKTIWDIPHKRMVDYCKARGPFLDHSQSFNVFIGNNKQDKANTLYKVLYYGWKQGLKTGIYYLRSQPAIQAQQFAIPLETLKSIGDINTNRKTQLEKVEEEMCLNCGT